MDYKGNTVKKFQKSFLFSKYFAEYVNEVLGDHLPLPWGVAIGVQRRVVNGSAWLSETTFFPEARASDFGALSEPTFF